MADAYPLQWPAGWPRTEQRQSSQFKIAMSGALDDLYKELELMGASNVVVSSDLQTRLDGRPLAKQREAEDPGVAVYFTRDGKEQCVPCDKWASVRENVRAIGLTIAALRSLDRYGAKETVDAAFAGFTAIPASASAGRAPDRQWYEVLEVSPDASKEVIDAAYKAKRKTTHPDIPGGSPEAFNEVTRAYDQAVG